MKKYRVLLVDDHQILRQALITYFEEQEKYDQIDEAANGFEALKKLNENIYDLVITDINMPEMDGIELLRQIKENYPEQLVMALTMLSEEYHIKVMVNLGINGYILKSCGKEEFFKATEEVLAGNKFYSQKVANQLVESLSKRSDNSGRLTFEKKLTLREIEIIRLIMEDKTNFEISKILFISERTVGTHKRNIMQKTGCKNLAGLAIYAIEKGLLDKK